MLSSHMERYGFTSSPSRWALVNAFVLPLLWLADMDLLLNWQAWSSRFGCCGTSERCVCTLV